MSTANYLDQAKSFLKMTALRVVPLAMATVALSHAATFNAPNNNTINSSCSGGQSGSLSGVVTNAGAGVSLAGNPAITASGPGSCTLTAVWKGTGSGTMTGGQISGNFTITPSDSTAILGYSLVIKINGLTQQTVTCASQPTVSATANTKLRPHLTNSTCSGPITTPPATVSAGTLSTYEADLSVTGEAFFESPTQFSVSVPAHTSIDIVTQAAASVPAMTPAALVFTALLLAAAGFRMAGWKIGTGSQA